VAVGAAIQANLLCEGSSAQMVLVDVTPLTLGVETKGDVYDPLIERNTAIPTKVSRTYTTASNFQPSVEIHVLQGERAHASQNKSLGRFHLDGIPPAPAGIPQIEVTFDIDANGILNVAAKDRGTGKQQTITITGSGQLSDNDVKRMVTEAESHRAEDERFRELAEVRNQADRMAATFEGTLSDLGDKVPEAEKTEIQAKIEALREAAKGEDVDAMRNAINEAQQAFSAVSQRIYQAAGQPPPGSGDDGDGQAQGPTPAADSEVIDAEFTAEDDK
jgi:molecular chaperone DnaK